MKSKSQSSIEFIILIGAILFFFSALLLVFNENIGEKSKANREKEFHEIALVVQNELNLAAETSDGYQRTFYLPERILNVDYTINLTENSIYIRTIDGKYAASFPAPNVTGQIIKGPNIIIKSKGVIYLNQ